MRREGKYLDLLSCGMLRSRLDHDSKFVWPGASGAKSILDIRQGCWHPPCAVDRTIVCTLRSHLGVDGERDGEEDDGASHGKVARESSTDEQSPDDGFSDSAFGMQGDSLPSKVEAAWPRMRDMGKIRDECKVLLAESRELVPHDFELAKQKWDAVLDAVESTGEPERIETAYNLVLNLCALAATRGRSDALETALDVMSRMVERGAKPTLVSFNTLMNVCAKSAAAGLGEQAVLNAHTVLQMMEEVRGIKADAITFTSMLDACARAAAVRGGRGGWTRGWQNGLDVLELMRKRKVPRTSMTYNVLISICVTGASMRREGAWVQEAVDRSVSVLTLMREDGVRPDSDTYNHLFSVCAKPALSTTSSFRYNINHIRQYNNIL